MHEVNIRKTKFDDLRAYAKQTNFRLILGGVGLLFIVGLGLILIFYGKGAVLTGFLCILAGLLPIFLILLFFQGIDWIIKKQK
jgi:hypothetical protein